MGVTWFGSLGGVAYPASQPTSFSSHSVLLHHLFGRGKGGDLEERLALLRGRHFFPALDLGRLQVLDQLLPRARLKPGTVAGGCKENGEGDEFC